MKSYCNDCKKDSIFRVNPNQDPIYHKGKIFKECIKCGRLEDK